MRNHSILMIVLMISVSLSLPYSLFQVTSNNELPVFSYCSKTFQENSSIDTTPPIISTPMDISYLVNSTGNTIEWYIADSNPSNYSILYNYWYIETERNISWTENKTVSISIDSLAIGLHIYTIIAEDSCGNQFSDYVPVTVIGTTNVITFTFSTTDPIDLSLLLDFLSSLGINIFVITLFVWIFINGNRYRKRRSLSSTLPPIDPLELELLYEDEY